MCVCSVNLFARRSLSAHPFVLVLLVFFLTLQVLLVHRARERMMRVGVLQLPKSRVAVNVIGERGGCRLVTNSVAPTSVPSSLSAAAVGIVRCRAHDSLVSASSITVKSGVQPA